MVVIGGSRGLTGAPTMAALAAMRAGAGYVAVAAPRSLELAFATRLLEAMFTGLPEEDGALTTEALEDAVGAISRADAVVARPRPRPHAGRAGARARAGRTASTSRSCSTPTA